MKPTTWDDVGGPGSIAPFENGLSLVISQTQEVHEGIEAVLAQMRKVMRETGAKGRTLFRSRPKKESGMGGMMGGMGGGMGGFGGVPAREQKGGRPAATPSLPAAAKPEWLPSKPHTLSEKRPAADDPFANRPPRRIAC